MNRLAFIILIYLLTGCASPESADPISVKMPEVKRVSEETARKTIMVTVDKDQQFYIGTSKVDSASVDSLLYAEIERFRMKVDTPLVVINADTAAFYGNVFRVMRLAKKHGAKVVANVR